MFVVCQGEQNKLHFIKVICQVWQKYPATAYLQVLRLLIIANKKHFKKYMWVHILPPWQQKRLVAVWHPFFLAENSDGKMAWWLYSDQIPCTDHFQTYIYTCSCKGKGCLTQLWWRENTRARILFLFWNFFHHVSCHISFININSVYFFFPQKCLFLP